MAKTKITKRKCVEKEEKPFLCKCGTRFLKRIYLNAHIKKFHADVQSSSGNTSSELSLVRDNFEGSDWSDPDIELGEPKESTDSGKSDESSSEEENHEDKEEKQDNDKSRNYTKENNEGHKRAEVDEQETEIMENKNSDGKAEIINDRKDKEKTGIMDNKSIATETVIKLNKDQREVREIYQGRLYSKPTKPIKIFAPKKSSTGGSACKTSVMEEMEGINKHNVSLPSKKTGQKEIKKQSKVNQEVERDDSDIDEIQITVKDKTKKRLTIKLPDGKKLKLDIHLE